jgi:PPM family protein phosphatase
MMMMPMSLTAEVQLDAATGISQGSREFQEDAVIADCAVGAELSLVVLADGMGGHAAGDVASKIAVTEVFSELKLQSGNVQALAKGAPDILRGAVLAANECIGEHVRTDASTSGMGTTLLALVLFGRQVFWVSVGDSPLLLYRDGELRQINEDHSLAPQIDLMVRAGQMSPEEGQGHPDRNCLTSVVCGKEIPRIDCPPRPIEIADPDILIAATDGLLGLGLAQIEEIVRAHSTRTSGEIVRALLDALSADADPDQDNATIAVIRAGESRPVRSWWPAGAGRDARTAVPASPARTLLAALVSPFRFTFLPGLAPFRRKRLR